MIKIGAGFVLYLLLELFVFIENLLNCKLSEIFYRYPWSYLITMDLGV